MLALRARSARRYGKRHDDSSYHVNALH